MNPTNADVLAHWGNSYIGINRANNLLDAIPKVTALLTAGAFTTALAEKAAKPEKTAAKSTVVEIAAPTAPLGGA